MWLLGAALTETGRATLGIALAGIVILAACGTALNFALTSDTSPKSARENEYMGWVGAGAAIALIIGGAIPGLWLPLVEKVVSIAGGSPGVTSDWTGLLGRNGLSSPPAAGVGCIGPAGGAGLAGRCLSEGKGKVKRYASAARIGVPGRDPANSRYPRWHK